MLPGLHRADTMKRHDERREARTPDVSEQRGVVAWGDEQRRGVSSDPAAGAAVANGRGYDAIDAARGEESVRGFD